MVGHDRQQRIARRAVAQLTANVVAPALDITSMGDCAGVAGTGRHSHRIGVRTQIDLNR